MSGIAENPKIDRRPLAEDDAVHSCWGRGLTNGHAELPASCAELQKYSFMSHRPLWGGILDNAAARKSSPKLLSIKIHRSTMLDFSAIVALVCCELSFFGG